MHKSIVKIRPRLEKLARIRTARRLPRPGHCSTLHKIKLTEEYTRVERVRTRVYIHVTGPWFRAMTSNITHLEAVYAKTIYTTARICRGSRKLWKKKAGLPILLSLAFHAQHTLLSSLLFLLSKVATGLSIFYSTPFFLFFCV